MNIFLFLRDYFIWTPKIQSRMFVKENNIIETFDFEYLMTVWCDDKKQCAHFCKRPHVTISIPALPILSVQPCFSSNSKQRKFWSQQIYQTITGGILFVNKTFRWLFMILVKCNVTQKTPRFFRGTRCMLNLLNPVFMDVASWVLWKDSVTRAKVTTR